MSGAFTRGGAASPGAQGDGWGAWLDPGERLLWEGAPDGGLRFRREDYVLVPFSLLWTGFAVFWCVGVWASGAPWPMLGFGVVFVFFGLHLLIGRFFWDAHVRGLTRYALTDRRALIATRHAGRRLQSWPLGAETTLDVEQGPATSIYFARDVSGHGRRRRSRRIGFEFIPDGPRVLAMIRTIQQGGRP